MIEIAAVAGALVVAGGAALFVRFPCTMVPALLVVAPLRLPLATNPANPLLFEFVGGGALGRLYPLYVVLVPAVIATIWRMARRRSFRRIPAEIAVPGAVLLGLACLSLLWSADPPGTVNALIFFWLPFALLFGVVSQSPISPRLTRTLGVIVVASASVFAVIGIWEAISHRLIFYTPALAIVNAHGPLFRVTAVFQDPSHLGRYLVLAIAVIFVALWLSRLKVAAGAALVVLLAAGLYVSYSQSSMVSMVVVLLALAIVAGDQASRRVAIVVCVVIALAGVGGLIYGATTGRLADFTRQRSRLAIDTTQVALAHPLGGVGLGAQAVVTRAEQNPGENVDRNASHTTPATVAAELGVFGLLAYLALLVGLARALKRVRPRDEALALGLGAGLLLLVVHSLFYGGFFDNPIVWGAMGLTAGAGALARPRPEPEAGVS
ncbi:MAG: hypothetical protein QOG62_2218 [Thermoleophilaceae bacterium]|nr:hypothetical protein [Thermoleophilaceae bacterium]